MAHGQVASGWGIAPKGCGHFFIVRTTWSEAGGFEHAFKHEYLHADGKWRPSTFNESNQPTGWHTTRRAAKALLAQAE